MDTIKINTVKFLMAMFENLCEESNGVKIFKEQVDELVRRHQIPIVSKNIVYNIYGIVNTDVFKPKAVYDKLAQISWLIMEADRRRVENNNEVIIGKYKSMIDENTKMGRISKSVKDIIYELYDLDCIKTKSTTSATIGPINTTKPPLVDIGLKSTPKKTSLAKSKEVLADISKFKPEYLSAICYEYLNPSYDGCSGSSKYLHIKLIDAVDKPVGARICYYTEIYNDGCHSRFDYVDVPTKCCKPKPPVSKPSIVTPYTDISTGCVRSGETRRC